MPLRYLLVFILSCTCCDAARILAVFPTPSISHQVVFRPLTAELARRGHQVVVVTTDPAYPAGQTPPNLTEIDVHGGRSRGQKLVSYKIWRETVLNSATTSGKSEDIFTQMKTMLPVLSQIFELQLQTDQVREVINNSTNQYDLILAEACIRPAVAISHLFKVPVILVSSFLGVIRNYDIMGAPMRPPLIYPTVVRQRIYNLTFWEKIVELYNHYRMEMVFDEVEREEEVRIKRMFGPDTPSLSQLENNVHLMLLNAHPIWDMNRPVPPSVIYMGGMHQKPSKELPKDLKSYLDASSHGVIYISFGTNVDPAALPAERIQLLVRVFSSLPYDVLWKWSQPELPGRSPNIRIAKWLPQSDLLKHPKVKLFITQGGLQSTDEAITAGVPLIGMPMLGDQWYNVEQYVHHRIGLRMDLETLTEDRLLEGINEVIGDESYRKNVLRLRSIMWDQPQPPLERAVWWVEHAARHGGAAHLRARAANLTWTEFLDLQLMLLATSLALLTLAAAGLVAVKVTSHLGQSKKIKRS